MKINNKLSVISEKVYFLMTFYPYLAARKLGVFLMAGGLFGVSNSAHAETIFEKIKNFGQGMKDIKDPIMWIAGIAGLCMVVGGLIHWRKTSQNAHQNQNGFSSGLVAILIGVALLGLSAFLASVGETVNLKSDF